jgi:hypothetical protein
MHVCQIILIEAGTPEQAFSDVASFLSEANTPDWSDWHNANEGEMNFAGRWSGAVFGSVDETGQFIDPEKNPNHLRYSDDPALAEDVITQYLEERISTIRNYQREAIDLSTYAYDPYKDKLDLPLYSTSKLAQLLGDDWTPDTGIYDLNNWTGNLRYFIQRVKSSPENQFLIPVDFHY